MARTFPESSLSGDQMDSEICALESEKTRTQQTPAESFKLSKSMCQLDRLMHSFIFFLTSLRIKSLKWNAQLLHYELHLATSISTFVLRQTVEPIISTKLWVTEGNKTSQVCLIPPHWHDTDESWFHKYLQTISLSLELRATVQGNWSVSKMPCGYDAIGYDAENSYLENMRSYSGTVVFSNQVIGWEYTESVCRCCTASVTGLHHLLLWRCWTLWSNYKPRHSCRRLQCKHNLDLVTPPSPSPCCFVLKRNVKTGGVALEKQHQKKKTWKQWQAQVVFGCTTHQALMLQCMWILRRRAHSRVHNPCWSLRNRPVVKVGRRGQNVASFFCGICSWTIASDLCFWMWEWATAAHTKKKNAFRSTCMRSWVGVVAESHQRFIFTTVISDHFSSVNKHGPCATSAGRPMQEDYPRQLILHSSRRQQKRSLSGRDWLAPMNVCQSRSNHTHRREWNATIYIEHKGAQFERFHSVQVQTFTHELYILLTLLCVKCYSSRKNPQSFW